MTQDEIRYERNPDYIFRRIVDELVLVPIRQDVADMDCIYTMNPVGALIWERLEGGATLAALQAAVVDQFAADPQVVAEDLLEFLAELEAAGAVWRV
ncbi:MAG: PqqD family protein [Anaerolineae bacterium]